MNKEEEFEVIIKSIDDDGGYNEMEGYASKALYDYLCAHDSEYPSAEYPELQKEFDELIKPMVEDNRDGYVDAFEESDEWFELLTEQQQEELDEADDYDECLEKLQTKLRKTKKFAEALDEYMDLCGVSYSIEPAEE